MGVAPISRELAGEPCVQSGSGCPGRREAVNRAGELNAYKVDPDFFTTLLERQLGVRFAGPPNIASADYASEAGRIANNGSFADFQQFDI